MLVIDTSFPARDFNDRRGESVQQVIVHYTAAPFASSPALFNLASSHARLSISWRLFNSASIAFVKNILPISGSTLLNAYIFMR